MKKLLLTIENTEADQIELSTCHNVKNLTICTEDNELFLWNNNKAVALKNGDTIIHQELRFKVHLINERQIETETQALNWLSPLQTDTRDQRTSLPQSNSNINDSLTQALDPLSFLSPLNQAPDVFAPLPVTRHIESPTQNFSSHNNYSKPNLLSRLKKTGKKLWQSTTPGTNQW